MEELQKWNAVKRRLGDGNKNYLKSTRNNRNGMGDGKTNTATLPIPCDLLKQQKPVD